MVLLSEAVEKEKVENLINKELKEALEGEDLNRIKSLKDQVQQALYAAGASVYQQTAGQGSGAPGQEPTAAAGGWGCHRWLQRRRQRCD